MLAVPVGEEGGKVGAHRWRPCQLLPEGPQPLSVGWMHVSGLHGVRRETNVKERQPLHLLGGCVRPSSRNSASAKILGASIPVFWIGL